MKYYTVSDIINKNRSKWATIMKENSSVTLLSIGRLLYNESIKGGYTIEYVKDNHYGIINGYSEDLLKKLNII